MDTLELALAVEFPFIYRYADLISLGFHLLTGGIEHRRRAEVYDLADLVFIQRLVFV